MEISDNFINLFMEKTYKKRLYMHVFLKMFKIVYIYIYFFICLVNFSIYIVYKTF